jgi:hypothetical protein
MRAYLWTVGALFALQTVAMLLREPGAETSTISKSGLTIARLLRIALLTWTIVLLAGCGGGDADEADARADTQPVDCKLHPELCK